MKIKKTPSIGLIFTTACFSVILIFLLSIFIFTYASFTNATKEAVSVQTNELSTQIVYNYESFISSMIGVSNIVQADIDSFDINNNASDFSDYLNNIVHLNPDIVKIALYQANDGRCLASSAYDYDAGADTKTDTWFFEAKNDSTIHVFSVPYEEVGNDYRINISKHIKYNSAHYLVLKMEVRFQTFIELIKKSNFGEGGHVAIIDSDYNVVYSSLINQNIEQEILLVKGIVLGSAYAKLDNHNMMVSVDTLINTRWRICVFINSDELNEIEKNFVITTLSVSFGVLLLASVIFYVIVKRITSPITQLESVMKKVERAEYFIMEKVKIKGTSEIQSLSHSFNKMMEKVRELMDRVVSEQKIQRKSELKALQNQINPHFLYNTLDSIIWLIENKKNQQAGQMVIALSRLFRVISKGYEKVKVSEEIEHVKNYLKIQCFRYGDSFDYSFEIDENVQKYTTLKLVLQPLVENAIYHGLKNKIDKGHIKISSKIINNNFLEFRVSDNGYGMKQSKIDELMATLKNPDLSDGVGLKNIYQRLMINYAGNAEMRIESDLDIGTTIIIKEPID